jgi:L-ascorbate metabolism protein UlaG (beta-lactamase superfamily)
VERPDFREPAGSLRQRSSDHPLDRALRNRCGTIACEAVARVRAPVGHQLGLSAARLRRRQSSRAPAGRSRWGKRVLETSQRGPDNVRCEQRRLGGSDVRVQWFGQSAFALSAGDTTVFIDPFADLSALASRGITFEYPAIDGIDAALVLVTHEHLDHNGVAAIGGDPAILRSTAGIHQSPVGEVTAVASEHDQDAGTLRGPNTIFAFELGGVRVCHFGDFGQRMLREEQASAIGSVDLLLVPVGDGPTIGAEQAWTIIERLAPRWVVPMHYRTARTDFLETEEAFVDRAGAITRLPSSSFETDDLVHSDGPLIVVPAAP